MRMLMILVMVSVGLMTTGCLRTVGTVVTAPVKIVGQGVDWATTSQDESDRNYGRRMRRAEAREGKERRAWEKRCRRDPDGCGAYDGYVASRDSRVH